MRLQRRLNDSYSVIVLTCMHIQHCSSFFLWQIMERLYSSRPHQNLFLNRQFKDIQVVLEVSFFVDNPVHKDVIYSELYWLFPYVYVEVEVYCCCTYPFYSLMFSSFLSRLIQVHFPFFFLHLLFLPFHPGIQAN